MSILISFIFFLLLILSLVPAVFDTKDRRKAYYIAIISLLSYTLLALISYGAYCENSSFFLFPDQEIFYEKSEQLGNLNSLYNIFSDIFIRKTDLVYVENQAAYFAFGSISYIANRYLDGNSVFLQIIHVAFLASLIPVFVFKTLNHFVRQQSAYKLTLYYIFCSYICYYSPYILRDIHISLLYSIGLSILYSSFRMYRLILLFVLSFVTMYFRLEHGMFMFFIPLLYIYEQTKGKKYVRYLLIFIVVVVIAFLSSIILNRVNDIMQTLERYMQYTSESAESTDGLGKYILELPLGIKQIVSILYSQISPFPSWGIAVNSKDIFQFVIGVVQMIAPAFWFMVWFCVVRLLIKKKYAKILPSILILSGFLFLFFLIANLSNINVRRLMCIYPILYIYYAVAKERYPVVTKKNKKIAIIIYIGLCLLYFIIK